MRYTPSGRQPRVSEISKKLKIAQKPPLNLAMILRLEQACRAKHILSGRQPRICERGITHYKRKIRS